MVVTCLSSLLSSHLCLQQDKDKELSPEPTVDSACSVSSYNIQVTEEVTQRSAEALSRTGILQHSETRETVRKTAAIKIKSVLSSLFLCWLSCPDDTDFVCVSQREFDVFYLTRQRVRLNTLKLLLKRGADPNLSRVPMPVVFLAIMAADTEAVRRLLLSGARTDIPLPPEAGNYFFSPITPLPSFP